MTGRPQTASAHYLCGPQGINEYALDLHVCADDHLWHAIAIHVRDAADGHAKRVAGQQGEREAIGAGTELPVALARRNDGACSQGCSTSAQPNQLYSTGS
jgi:hypothetical protein